MNMYTNNLGIETDCLAGTPSYTKPKSNKPAEEFIQ